MLCAAPAGPSPSERHCAAQQTRIHLDQRRIACDPARRRYTMHCWKAYRLAGRLDCLAETAGAAGDEWRGGADAGGVGEEVGPALTAVREILDQLAGRVLERIGPDEAGLRGGIEVGVVEAELQLLIRKRRANGARDVGKDWRQILGSRLRVS
jgi:hypothetical protein